jgi:hypothetical protein
MQEQMARRKAMAKRAHVMQQQIKQERPTQMKLQQEIEHLHQQEHEPSDQEPPLQQHSHNNLNKTHHTSREKTT